MQGPDEIERAIEAFAREPNGGLIVLPGPVTVVHRELIIALVARHRLGTLTGDELRNRMAQSSASIETILNEQVSQNVELFKRLLASFAPVAPTSRGSPIAPDDRTESKTGLRRPQRTKVIE